jgi:hypothetical protein
MKDRKQGCNPAASHTIQIWKGWKIKKRSKMPSCPVLLPIQLKATIEILGISV